jgi:hypothetical protein
MKKLIGILSVWSIFMLGCDDNDSLEYVKNSGGPAGTNDDKVMVTENLEIYNYHLADQNNPMFLASKFGVVYNGTGEDGRIDNTVDMIFLGDTLCSTRFIYDRNPAASLIQQVHHTAFRKLDITKEQFDSFREIDEIKPYIPSGEAKSYNQFYNNLAVGDYIAFLCCLRHAGILEIKQLSNERMVFDLKVIPSVD